MKPGDLMRPDWALPFWRSPEMRKRRVSPQSTFTVKDDDPPPEEEPDSIRVEFDGQCWDEWLPRQLFVLAI
ncbi:hypothetical protein [Roseomonas populi]|uniref:Uncharacterized protein n=1 Tax=Roseomonas populi TaxID=3121582 RepID=A0ABT1XCH2_9PROT|nr:hypothetical protein [Roseomonas pecuniae]MCR0985836.1 hypothetical protein [Roseomonas pecuniae]